MFRIHYLYLLLIISLPIVDGVLRIRLGAGWEPSIVFAVGLFLAGISIYHKFRPIRSTFRWLLLPASLLCISNFFGYVYYSDGFNLDAKKIEQINSIEARIIVESARYMVCIFVFLFTYFYLDSVRKIISVASAFVFASLVEGFYGLYEFFVKLSGFAGVFPLLRGSEGNVHSILRSYGTFFEPSNFGQFMACSVFFYVGYLSLVNRVGHCDSFLIRGRLVVLFVFVSSILVSFSRTAFLGVFVGVLFKVLADVFSGSGARIRSAFRWSVSVVILVAVCVGVVVQLVSEQYVERWVTYTLDFSSDIDYENTAVSRGKSLVELGSSSVDTIRNFPLGIGQGMAYLESPFTPFIVRLPLELGVIASFVFFAIVVFIVFNAFRSKSLINGFMPSIACLLVCFLNYNSTNHVWIWFCLGFFFRLSSLIWLKKTDENFSRYHHD